MSPRHVEAGAAVRRGRMTEAQQFADAANSIRDLADDATDITGAHVTLCVHAGIAASDVVGEGTAHRRAVDDGR